MKYIVFGSGTLGCLGAARAASLLLERLRPTVKKPMIQLVLERRTPNLSPLLQWLDFEAFEELARERGLLRYLKTPKTTVHGPRQRLDLREVAQVNERQNSYAPWMTWAGGTDHDESWLRRRLQHLIGTDLALDQALDAHIYPPLLRATLAVTLAPKYPFFAHEVTTSWLQKNAKVQARQKLMFTDLDQEFTRPWLDDLQKEGVEITWVDQIVRADFDGTEIRSLVVEDCSKRSLLFGDQFLSVMPRSRLVKILPLSLKQGRGATSSFVEELASLSMRVVHSWRLENQRIGFEGDQCHLGMTAKSTAWRLSLSKAANGTVQVDLWDFSKKIEGIPLQNSLTPDLNTLEAGILIQLGASQATYLGSVELRDPLTSQYNRIGERQATSAANLFLAGEWLTADSNTSYQLLRSSQAAVSFMAAERAKKINKGWFSGYGSLTVKPSVV